MLRVVILLGLATSLGFGQIDKLGRDPLGISVTLVTKVADTCGNNIIDAALLKQDIEVKLRVDGIKITDETPSQLWGVVNCAHLNSDGERLVSAIYVSLCLRQVVLVSRELKTVGLGTTWNQDNVYVCGLRQKCDQLIRNAMRDFADGFVNDYLEMNPKN